MEAGRLRQRVTIEEKVESRDTYGGERDTWVTFATRWAEVAPLVGREYLEGRQLGAEISVRVRIRYLADVKPHMRVKFGTEYYDIESVQNVETRDREMVLMCKEIVS